MYYSTTGHSLTRNIGRSEVLPSQTWVSFNSFYPVQSRFVLQFDINPLVLMSNFQSMAVGGFYLPKANKPCIQMRGFSYYPFTHSTLFIHCCQDRSILLIRVLYNYNIFEIEIDQLDIFSVPLQVQNLTALFCSTFTLSLITPSLPMNCCNFTNFTTTLLL